MSVGPVDVRIAVPPPLALSLSDGQEVSLRTHLHVREDRLDLYGFASDAALQIFELLLSVSGIGPKLALGIIGAMEPAEVRRAIVRGDAQALARAPGVGARAATRIVADLQPKIGLDWAEPAADSDTAAAALAALITMGYSSSQAREAVSAVPAGSSAEDTLRGALSVLADR